MKPVPALAGALLASLLSGTSHAIPAPATLNLNTGTDANGTVLAAGTLDPFWTISTDGIGFSAARVAYPGAYPNFGSGQTCCGMETVGNSAAWITTPSVVATSPSTGWGVGNIVYARRTFDLSAFDLDTVGLSGSLRVADSAAGLFINGTLVAGTNASGGFTFAQDVAFNVASGSGVFLAGLNTLELRGTSVNDVWDAMWLSTTVTGQTAPVPEPGTWAMLLAGLGAIGLWRSSRR